MGAPQSGPAQKLQTWFNARGRWQRLGLAALAGALMTAGHPPVSIPWLMFLACPMLVLLLRAAPTWKAAAWTGWAAGAGYFVTGLHWIGHAFLVDAERFAFLLPLGVIAMPSALAIFWALAFGAAHRLAGRGAIQSVLWLVLCLTGVETARSFVLTGFPWALPGYVWVDTPVIQVAAWIGPFGVTLMTLLVCAMIGIAALHRRVVPLVICLAAFAASWVAGTLRVPDEVAYTDNAPVLRIVQPNAPQHLKWQPGPREMFYGRLLEATAAQPDPQLGPADLVIWPEMAVFFAPAQQPEEVARIAQAAGGAPVMLGAFHAEGPPDNIAWRNALMMVRPDGTLGQRYDKHHLVPFGEYMPMRPLFDALGLSQFAIRGDIAAGPGPMTMHLPGLPPVSPLICYEAIFPYHAVGKERPDWMVQLTNDAWFGSFAGPQQHYAQARIRAIEQGLPLVRAANTGISAVVDAYGREVVSIELHNYKFVDAQLPAPAPVTLYSRWGDWLAMILIVILAATAVFSRQKLGRH
ncbi:MAG: apolipoprotein N-acyltransferase [Pseudomonadota bacterium]